MAGLEIQMPFVLYIETLIHSPIILYGLYRWRLVFLIVSPYNFIYTLHGTSSVLCLTFLLVF